MTRLVLASVLLFANACSPTPGSGACTTSSECSRGQRCLDGVCLAPDDDAGRPDSDAGTGTGDDAGASPSVDASDTPFECGATSFALTDTQESLVVPPNVRFMHVKAWGAGGNDERSCGETPDGGLGGFTEAVFEVAPGTELVVIVGRRGRSGTAGEDLFRFGFGAWGGGGLSGVFRGPGPITEHDAERALVVAGGGGSASAPDCSAGIPGNHPSAGGAETMLGLLPGGDSPLGGAGGYVGGSAGSRSTPSAGGVGFVDVDAFGALTHRDSRMLFAEPGSNVAPAADDPDYLTGVAESEQSGHIVIRYLCVAPPPLI